MGDKSLQAPDWGVCVHCWAAGLGCGWPWDRNSVHKWEERASGRQFGAFVYTVGLWEILRATIVYTNGLRGPLNAGLEHLCTLLCRGRPGGPQECTQMGGSGLSAPDWGVYVHCWAAGLGCGWPWDRNSVHKWEERASGRRFGAFVYTVGLREILRATIVYTNGLRGPLHAGLGRLCTLLRRGQPRGARRWETGIISKHTRP